MKIACSGPITIRCRAETRRGRGVVDRSDAGLVALALQRGQHLLVPELPSSCGQGTTRSNSETRATTRYTSFSLTVGTAGAVGPAARAAGSQEEAAEPAASRRVAGSVTSSFFAVVAICRPRRGGPSTSSTVVGIGISSPRTRGWPALPTGRRAGDGVFTAQAGVLDQFAVSYVCPASTPVVELVTKTCSEPQVKLIRRETVRTCKCISNRYR